MSVRVAMYEQLKESVCRANKMIPEHELAIFTFGNISAMDYKAGVFAIKPSGVSYNKLTVDKIVVLDIEGNVVNGSFRPSSDTATHLYLYQKFQGIKGIIHTHSPYAVAWSQARRSIPVYGTTHADHTAQEVPCVPLMNKEQVEGEYELETGKSIVDYFLSKKIKPEYCPMCLIAGHGPFAWGEDAEKALYHGTVLEQIAQMAWLTESLGNKAPLPQYYTNKHFMRKHGPGSYYGQDNREP